MIYLMIPGPIKMNLEERKQAFVSCIATGAHPGPEFKWYIADTLLSHSDL